MVAPLIASAFTVLAFDATGRISLPYLLEQTFAWVVVFGFCTVVFEAVATKTME